MTLIYSAMCGLSMLEANGIIKVVDDDLNMYDEWECGDASMDEKKPIEDL